MPTPRKLLNKKTMEEIKEFRFMLREDDELFLVHHEKSLYVIMTLNMSGSNDLGTYRFLMSGKNMIELKLKYYEFLESERKKNGSK